jgi:hypothetical protein
VLRALLALVVLAMLAVGAGSELARAAGLVDACCDCGDGDEDCCDTDLGACGCAAPLALAPAVVAGTKTSTPPVEASAAAPLRSHGRIAGPPPTPPPIG